MTSLRRATAADLALVFPRTRALNDHEGIAISDAKLEGALRHLLDHPALGAVWLIERDRAPIGYAITTFGYDLEFAGREAWLTEIWIDDAARGAGAATAAIDLLAAELRALDIQAVHLQVRPDNPAMRLYQRLGFAPVPRTIMTRRLA